MYRPCVLGEPPLFREVNVSNTVVNTTVINNYYNNTNVTNVNYVNRQVPGAVVAVPTTAFVQSQPVRAFRRSRDAADGGERTGYTGRRRRADRKKRARRRRAG